MLIGPSITLKALEEHMNDRLYEIKTELPKLQKEFNQLREDFKKVSRVKENDKGEEIVNPEFTSLPDKMSKIESKITELINQQEFIESKIVELSTIEERSKGRGNIDKEKEKINLTLNDCLRLGIAPDETNPSK